MVPEAEALKPLSDVVRHDALPAARQECEQSWREITSILLHRATSDVEAENCI
jgi:hypothetical protein